MKSIVTEKIRESVNLEESDDKFGYNNMAEYLLNYVLSKKFPISIGVYGEWGSGKSVFLGYLKKHAKRKKLNIIEIDAIEERGCKLISKVVFNVIKKERSKIFYLILLVVLTVVLLILFLNPYFKIKELVGKASGYSFFVLISFSGMVFLWGTLLELFSLIKKWIENFKDKVAILFIKRKTVVIIENIDRLNPKEAIIFLEKLKSFFLEDGKFSSANFAYFIPCDVEVLKEEIRLIYQDKDINVRDYLNKLIEVPFYIPRYSSQKTVDLVESLLNKDIPKKRREKICNVFETSYLKTIRDVKNFLFELDMLFVITKARGLFEEEYILSNLDKIIAYKIVGIKFPKFLDFVRSRKNEISKNSFNESGFRHKLRGYIYRKREGTSPSSLNGSDEIKYNRAMTLFLKTQLFNSLEPIVVLSKDFNNIVKIVESSSRKAKLVFDDNIIIK